MRRKRLASVGRRNHASALLDPGRSRKPCTKLVISASGMGSAARLRCLDRAELALS